MRFMILVTLLVFALAISAEESMQEITMQTSDYNTFYVNGTIKGAQESSLLVDTGSGYTTINQDTLAQLQSVGEATYLRKLEGILADGSRLLVSVYRISGINIGANCYVPNVEVAVFPTGTREILGLSTLSKVAPFMFSMEPPRLLLSNCNQA